MTNAEKGVTSFMCGVLIGAPASLIYGLLAPEISYGIGAIIFFLPTLIGSFIGMYFSIIKRP